jgi:NAD(P)-dependent dehydrogenase (short-subunit alcohol dehydrogenase family)
VNNAGVVHRPAPVLDTDPDVLRRVLAVNVEGLALCARAAGRVMAAAGHGRIVNIASARGKLAWPGLGAYSASKAAVIALTQALALELGPRGVTVNAICPGTMWTEMAQGAFSTMAAEQGTPLEDLLAAHVRGIPVGRLGTPDDVGALAAFLASDAAAFVTAAAINLTGGEDAFF